jgi:hypothetical protein
MKAHDVTVYVERQGEGTSLPKGVEVDGMALLMPRDAEVATSISEGGGLVVTVSFFATDVKYIER